MAYAITEYSKRKAASMSVIIKPSTRKHKKIDVFKNGRRLCSIGDTRYGDFPTFLRTHGKEYADKRRKLYHLRHTTKGIASRYAKAILW